jgi:hypothetical protein
MDKLWLPKVLRPSAKDRERTAAVVADLNRALARARRLTNRALLKPLGSNGRSKDLREARQLVDGVFALCEAQGWEKQLLETEGVAQMRDRLTTAR